MGNMDGKSAILVARRMKKYLTSMLQIAFNEAYTDAYGENWFSELRAISKKRADDANKPERDITARCKSVNKMDLQALAKTLAFIDEYRSTLITYYGIDKYEHSIKQISYFLIDYRNNDSDEHDGGENEKKVKIHEIAMDEMRTLAGYFSSIVNPETNNTYKKDIENLYSEYVKERDKRFYPLSDIFDLTQHSIEELSFGVTAAQLKTDWKAGKLGFYSSDLERDKGEILKAIAVKNIGKGREEKVESKPAPKPQPQPQLKPQPQQSSVPPVAPQPRVNTVPVQQNAFVPKKADSEKTQKTIAIVLVAIIAVLVIVFAAKLVSLIKARHQQATPSTTVSTTVSTTQPTTTTTTQPTTTTTTKKEKVTYVEGEAVYGDKLHFIVEKQPLENGTIELKIKNKGETDYYIGNPWGKTAGAYINGDSDYVFAFNKDDILEPRPEEPYSYTLKVGKYDKIKTITIKHITYYDFGDHEGTVTINIKTTKE